MTEEVQTEEVPKKAKKYKYVPKKDKKTVENVEVSETVQENVEAPAEIVAENVEAVLEETPVETTEVVVENVETADFWTEGDPLPETITRGSGNVFTDIGIETPEHLMKDTEEYPKEESAIEQALDTVVESVKKVMRKVPDNFDIVRWRRLGRR